MRKMQIVVVFAVLLSAAVAQDSLNCREKGSWPFGRSYAVAHDASRNLVFCGSGGGVYVLDVSNPAAPQKLSEAIHTRGLVDGLCYQANRLYIAAEQAGLEVWDVTDPQAPARLGYYDTPDEACGVAVAGDYAYVADSYAGLRVISVADPAHPSEVGYYDTPGTAYGVAVAGDHAYVADTYAGLRVISVADPAHPSEVGYYVTPDYVPGVAVAGNYAYVADQFAGLRVIEYCGSGVEETMNDERGTMNVGPTVVRGMLYLPEASSHKPQAASLLDISGRKVVELHPGANDVSRLSPGVYFVRTVSGKRSAQRYRKVVIQR